MVKGKVKWYDDTKGFGFIESETGEEIFVHKKGLYNPFGGLKPKQEVTFEIEVNAKGKQAVIVELVK
jgi:CspA family cold shock protein